MSLAEYIEAIDTVEQLVDELELPNRQAIREMLDEMRFGAHFNHRFREDTRDDLLELIDVLYARTQD